MRAPKSSEAALPADVSKLRQALATQREARAAAQQEQARLREMRPELLLDASTDGDAKLDSHDIAAVRAARAVERAEASIRKIEADLAEASALMERERQAKLYAEGQKAAAEYRRLAEEEYATAARGVADVLLRMGALSRKCDAVNRDRPADTRPIDCDAFTRAPHPSRPLPPLYTLVYLPSVEAADPDFWNWNEVAS